MRPSSDKGERRMNGRVALTPARARRWPSQVTTPRRLPARNSYTTSEDAAPSPPATAWQPNNARTSGKAQESSEQHVHWVHEVMLLLGETEV
jgi:hypothetical protein